MLTDRLYRALGAFPPAQKQFRRVLRRLPHRTRSVERRGQRLMIDPSELSGFYLYYDREYDDGVFAFLDTVVANYACVFDIGANIGVYTCYFAARVPHVHAFEPDRNLSTRIRANLALNSLTNVTLHEACVGSATGTIRFYPADEANTGVGSVVASGGQATECPCVCLDDVLPGLCSGPCLIKMDIEGAEWLAIEGAGRALGAPGFVADLLIEVHPTQIAKLGGDVERLRHRLIDLGYSLSCFTSGGLTSLDASVQVQRFWWASRRPDYRAASK